MGIRNWRKNGFVNLLLIWIQSYIIISMKLKINIENDIFKQFAEQVGVEVTNNSMQLEKSIGEGSINLSLYPNSLEFYHFKFKLKQALQLNSKNPANSEYLLLNINLSENTIEKKVNGEDINFQKYLPSGILYYPPNIKVESKSPINKAFEIVLIKFPKNLLNNYFLEQDASLFNIKDTLIYEDLDFKSEDLLKKIISNTNKLKSHSHVLEFLSIFYDKLKSRESNLNYENLHDQDIKQLFMAASLLRNPTNPNPPTIEELAKIAKMGKTKFKKIFKQIFGSAPKQYHQKIRMEYAKEKLQLNEKTASEIAYELGYAHPSKFSRAFKNFFGKAPSKI